MLLSFLISRCCGCSCWHCIRGSLETGKNLTWSICKAVSCLDMLTIGCSRLSLSGVPQFFIVHQLLLSVLLSKWSYAVVLDGAGRALYYCWASLLRRAISIDQVHRSCILIQIWRFPSSNRCLILFCQDFSCFCWGDWGRNLTLTGFIWVLLKRCNIGDHWSSLLRWKFSYILSGLLNSW